MATVVMIHGASDGGWYWHLVEAELQARGHRTVAPDLPAGDDSATLGDYADVVVDAVDTRDDGPFVVVGQSFGGFTAPLAADRLNADLLVLASSQPASSRSPRSRTERSSGRSNTGPRRTSRCPGEKTSRVRLNACRDRDHPGCGGSSMFMS